MSEALEHFHHIFIDNKVEKTLFLLHGTGGDENDLLPLVKPLEHEYNFLGLKGNISERGLSRFFVRTEEGVFDQDSIIRESKKLCEFIEAWKVAHATAVQQTAFLGYSNGANMILAQSFLHPENVSRAVLLHSMLPFTPENSDLSNKQFLVTYGENDQMIPLTKSLEVIDCLEKCKAHVEIVKHAGGHEIQKPEVQSAHRFLLLR